MTEDPGTRLDRDAVTTEPDPTAPRDEVVDTPDETVPTQQHPFETPSTPDNTRADS